MSDHDSDPAPSASEYTFPGTLSVENLDAPDAPHLDNYVQIDISTPINDERYYFKTNDFDCPLHPAPVDAVCIYYDDQHLTAVYPTGTDGSLEVRQHLKNRAVTIERFDSPVADPEVYQENSHVVWTAPQEDAAIIED